MNIDAIGMLAITTGVGIAQAIFWYWVNSLKNNSEKNTKTIDDVKTDLTSFKLEVSQNYQSKADAHKDLQLITDMLKEIKADVKQLNDKLDKKADKT